MTATYLESDKTNAAKQFVSAYLERSQHREGFAERFKVHMLHERILAWGLAKATDNVTWKESLPFREWAREYVEFKV